LCITPINRSTAKIFSVEYQQFKIKRESADKPGSVVDNHSSGYMSPCTSSNLPENSADHALRPPIWSCSEWGLPCHKRLPVARCALTAPFHPYPRLKTSAGGLFSAALSVGFHLPGVTWHSVLWSPDFPPQNAETFWRDCLANSQGDFTLQKTKVDEYILQFLRLKTVIRGLTVFNLLDVRLESSTYLQQFNKANYALLSLCWGA